MSFDDSTGGIDRLQFRNQQDVYGNDFGDGKPKRLFEASRTYEERREVDSVKQAEYLARRARIAADATRRRSAPVEAAILADNLARSKTSMGAAFREAYARRQDRD
jgi:hypothetical protein